MATDSFMDTYFSPISGKDLCNYFFYLSVFGFVSGFIYLFRALYVGFKQKTQSFFYYLSVMFVFSINMIFGYFANRLLYSMCVHSIN